MRKKIDFAEFAAVWNQSDGATDVASKLGISLDAVYSRLKSAKALGHSCKHMSERITDDEFVGAYASSDSDEETAQKLGISPLYVRQRASKIRDAGGDLPYRRKSAAGGSANILSQSEVLAKLGIPRQTFTQGIRPLMLQNGDCRNLAEGRRTMWAYDGATLWRWADYLEKRAALIALGHPGWHSKRPYSLEDMYNLVDAGVLDDEIDHPAFTEKR